jgi:hypothetical protein
MNIIVSYDSSVDSAPAGFKTDVEYAVQVLDNAFSNDVTITIDVGWGEYDNSPVTSGFLGRSFTAKAPAYHYADIVGALENQAAQPGASPELVQAVQTFAGLPDPTNGGTFDIGLAEAKALGLVNGNTGEVDGWVGFFGDPATWSYSTTQNPASGKYYLVGTIEHEITEVMGRNGYLDTHGENYPNAWGVPDLFRFSAPGVRQLADGPPHSTGYFSIDNGTTPLGTWNNHFLRGDFTDWDLGTGSGGGPGPQGSDAFNDFSNAGVLNQITNTDLTLMHMLGWEASQPPNIVINGEMYFIDQVHLSAANLLIESGGSVEVDASGVLNGAVSFDGPGGLLTIDGPAAPANTIDGFVAGDTIDFFGAAIGALPSVKLLAGNVLEIKELGHTYDFFFDPNEDFSGQSFHVTDDGFGDTLIFIAPGVQSVTTSGPGIVSGNGDLNAGHTVTFSLNMNEAVNVDTTHGVPTLSLNDGGVATYSGGSGTNELTFTYTVATGENTPDLAVTAFNPHGSTAQDANGHSVDFSAAVANPAGTLQINTTPPNVTGASLALATGSIEWVFSFDKPVEATGDATILWGELSVDTAATAALHDPTKLVFEFSAVHGFEFASAPQNYSNGITDLAGNAPVHHNVPLPPFLALASIIGEVVDHLEDFFHWPAPNPDAGSLLGGPAFDLSPQPPAAPAASGAPSSVMEGIENTVHTAFAASGLGHDLFHLLV